MPAIGYRRVSTSDQADDGVSLDAQQQQIQAWCHLNGHDLSAIHTDAGISGKRADNRPGLQHALHDACQSPGGILVVFSLSRLARSTKDAIAIAERLDQAGADLVSLSEKLDTSSASGRLVFRMLAVLAEFERDLVSERTKAALDHKARCGQRIGEIPYGKQLAPDGIALIKNPDEQRTLTLMRRLRHQSWTYRAIAEHLTRRNIPTKKGNPRWTHQAVARILKRPTERPQRAAG